jgi:predicted DNA binding protein
MWVAEFTILDRHCIYSQRTKRFNLFDLFYPIASFERRGKPFVAGLHILKGEEKGKKHFIAAVKKDRRIKRLEQADNLVITLASEPGRRAEHVKHFYNPEIFPVEPAIFDNRGMEHWKVACWRKRPLSELVAVAVKHYEGRLISLQQSKLQDIFIPHALPKLTQKQQQALELAFRCGYYTHPRKADLRQLAKKAGLALSTFQEHLRKAETSLLPFLIKDYLGKKGRSE